MYEANIEEIQAGLVQYLHVCNGWGHDNPVISSATGIVEDYVTNYFESLEYDGVIEEFDPTVVFGDRDGMVGILVDVDCLFPKDCKTNRLTFRHNVLAD